VLLRVILAGSLLIAAGSASGQERLPARPNPCAAHGPGFAPVGGTDTCLRVSGRVRADADVGSRRSIGGSRDGAGARLNAEARAGLDARTTTEAGPLRTVVRVRARRGEPSR
jgi:hypothetical protein